MVMYRLLKGLDHRIQTTKQDREQRKNFTIEDASKVSSLRVMQSPAGGLQAGQDEAQQQ